MWINRGLEKLNYCCSCGLRNQLVFVVIISVILSGCSSVGNEWETEDTVIVEPELTSVDFEETSPATSYDATQAPDQVSRTQKQFSHYPLPWPHVQTMAGMESCYTNRGEFGYCATLRQCYPALYTNIVDEQTDDLKDVIMNPGLAEALQSVSGNCKSSAMNTQFYFKTDAELLRQNLICCASQQTSNPVVSSHHSPTTLGPISLRYPGRPKIPIGFGGHRPPSAVNKVETSTEGFVVQSSCGVQKIVGGNETCDGKYPWIVALFNGHKQICGGSLIDNNYILTAAHCVSHMKATDVARLRVLLGTCDIRQINQGAVARRVSKLMRHRGFTHKTLHNDIAVLKLDSPVQFDDKIRPICLDMPDFRGTKRYDNTQAIVVGWGSISEFGPQPPTLREVKIDVWSNDQCKRKYGHLAPGGITEHMMCAGSINKDACRGDSGGPLMSFDGMRYSQIGLVSFGIGCGRFPGVYSRISDFRQWIDKQREL